MTTAIGTGLRRAAARLAPDPTPDGELLARFLASRDEVAFARLVQRHAGMVFGTCRRVLGNATDADDAFQAAFVVLVRKAHSLTDRMCVGNFLYGVAFHTALKARAMATKRRAKEEKVIRPEPADTGELTRVLDEELAKLPDKYREPVVLCELDGVSRKEAAARLGIAEGTISSRLATAHRMLAKRLTARGFVAGAVALLLKEQAYAVPNGLADAAVQAAAVGPSADVTQLASEVSKMLLWNKLKMGVVVAGVLMACSVGFNMMAKAFAADDKAVANAPAPKKDTKDDQELIQGLWQEESLESGGQKVPASGEVKFQVRFKGNAMTFVADDRTHTFELDPAVKPKAMNLTPGDGSEKGKKLECAIYELDGDTLTICMDKEGHAGKRPTEFKTTPNDGLTLLVLKRVKEKNAPAKAEQKGDAKKPEADKSYSLKEGEVLKLIPAPFPAEREDVFTQVNQRRALAGRARRYRMVIPADGIELQQCFAASGAENGWELRQALTAVLKIDPMDCVADDELLATMFDADNWCGRTHPSRNCCPHYRPSSRPSVVSMWR